MSFTTRELRGAIAAIRHKIESEHEHLTEMDGKLGDGDLGITMLKAFRKLDEVAPGLPDDLGQAFMGIAQAIASVSSSSFGTLMATSAMSAAKELKGKTEASWESVPSLLRGACDAMMKRGRGNLGDKTVLDPVDAAASAMSGLTDPGALLAAARSATAQTIKDYHDKPNKLGRARIFGDKTIGMDDPGMAAFATILDGLAEGGPSS